MKDLKSTCRIALVQAEPVMFDKEACLSKALDYIHEAAREHAELIVFPELFIPGYPIGLNFGFSMGKRTEDEVGIHAVRMGNIVGIHEVMIGTQNEMITLKHEAFSRGVFADGSVKAAVFLAGKSAGLYDMKDLLREGD